MKLIFDTDFFQLLLSMIIGTFLFKLFGFDSFQSLNLSLLVFIAVKQK